MTSQEQQLLQDLTNRLNQTVLPDKDPEAEQFLSQSLGRNPDALYLLAQTVLVQQYALEQAKKQLDDANQRAQAAPPAPVKHTSFLGSLLGTEDRPSTPPAPPPQQNQQAQYAPVPNYPPPSPQYVQSPYGQPGFAPPPYGQPSYGQPGYGQPGYGQAPYGQAPFGGGGFLGSALRTAGTVAAGTIAFEGIEHLLHGFGEHAGYGSNFGEFGGSQPREEIVNNYYGDSAGHERGGLSPDIEDRRDDSSHRAFADNANDSDYTNDGSADDDDNSLLDDDTGDGDADDSSSFDDDSSDTSEDDFSSDDGN